jgi:hypothetical protein
MAGVVAGASATRESRRALRDICSAERKTAPERHQAHPGIRLKSSVKSGIK